MNFDLLVGSAIKGKQTIKTASGDQNAGRGDKIAEAWRRIERHQDGFTGPGGNTANLEAARSFLRGSWRLCTPSLLTTPSLFFSYLPPYPFPLLLLSFPPPCVRP